MTIGNIIDRRENSYIVDCDAVFEPSWHDNSHENSTKFKNTDDLEDLFQVYHLYNTTVEQAINYVGSTDTPMTIYLYDKDSKPCG